MIIQDMQFQINSKDVDDLEFPENLPDGIKTALGQFLQVLSETSNNSETQLKMGEVKATTRHQGINLEGKSELFTLNLEDESDGLPGMDDNDDRNKWLCKNCKTFSNVYEAIDSLEKL